MIGKFILDAACGGRMIWFNKNHPNVVYMDNDVREKGCIEQQPNFEVNPDILGDFTDMKFPDNSFKLVLFDPPHAFISPDCIIGKKYGALTKDNWKELIKKGFDECMRVLQPYGVLIFKWGEVQVTVRQLLDVVGEEPLFGHTTAKSGKTKWLCFMKIPEVENRLCSCCMEMKPTEGGYQYPDDEKEWYCYECILAEFIEHNQPETDEQVHWGTKMKESYEKGYRDGSYHTTHGVERKELLKEPTPEPVNQVDKECKSRQQSTRCGIKKVCDVPGPTRNVLCSMVTDSLTDLVCPTKDSKDVSCEPVRVSEEKSCDNCRDLALECKWPDVEYSCWKGKDGE